MKNQVLRFQTKKLALIEGDGGGLLLLIVDYFKILIIQILQAL